MLLLHQAPALLEGSTAGEHGELQRAGPGTAVHSDVDEGAAPFFMAVQHPRHPGLQRRWDCHLRGLQRKSAEGEQEKRAVHGSR